MATTNTPGLTRLSPGVYRNPQGQTVRQAGGMTQRPVTSAQKPPPVTAGTYTDVNRVGNRIAYLQKNRPNDAELGRLNTWKTNFGNPVTADTYKDINRVNNRIAFLQKNRPKDPELVRLNTWKTNFGTPAQTAAPTPEADKVEAQATPQAPQPTMPEQKFEYQQSPMTAALMEAMKGGLNTMQAYEPKFYEGSPLYQFQKEQGTKDLEKLMASRGLTGSGAEIQANSDFLSKLGADESEKARQYAEQAANRQQQSMQFLAGFDREERQAQLDQWNKNTDRQMNMQEFDAQRGDRRNELAMNFFQNILGLQGQNNIASLAAAGQNDQSALSKALYNMLASNTANNYTRSYGGGGGTAPVAPTSSDNAIMRELMGYGNRAGNNDVIDFISRLFTRQ
jgi:hypothetical protein